jgi:hypothetical protein
MDSGEAIKSGTLSRISRSLSMPEQAVGVECGVYRYVCKE